MTVSLYTTWADWEFGVGFCFPTKGTAVEGLITIRPWAFNIMFGPWSLAIEKNGRQDIYYDWN